MIGFGAVDALHDLLVSVVPNDVAFAGGGLERGFPDLFDVEEAVMARASARRRREFVAGRGYARAALAALGCPACPIPVGKDRRPIWPAGYIGSISHTNRLCVAIAAREDDYCGLGIDVETDAPLESDLQRIVCRPEERHQLISTGRAEVDVAKMLFAAKEAMFKAYYPTTNVFLDFCDVLVEFDEWCASFRATLVAGHAPELAGRRCFDGRAGRIDSHLVAAVTIARGA